MPLPVAPTPQ
jgi:hypothetical protein